MFASTGTLRKPREYAEARRLRRDEGMSIKRIAASLGVSPATVHVWTSDIELTPEQRHRNLYGQRGPANPEHVAARAAAWSRKCRAKRLAHQLDGRDRARQWDPIHMAGCMLYWAEGTKSRNTLKLANSDPELVKFFCRFLRDSLGVRDEDIRLSLNVYLGNGLTITEIEHRWLAALSLPRTCLCKHTINSKPTSSSGTKRNKLPYGVATIRVNSTQLVQQVYGAIQEYAGFENPAWLD